jgi:hypothetical protein
MKIKIGLCALIFMIVACHASEEASRYADEEMRGNFDKNLKQALKDMCLGNVEKALCYIPTSSKEKSENDLWLQTYHSAAKTHDEDLKNKRCGILFIENFYRDDEKFRVSMFDTQVDGWKNCPSMNCTFDGKNLDDWITEKKTELQLPDDARIFAVFNISQKDAQYYYSFFEKCVKFLQEDQKRNIPILAVVDSEVNWDPHALLNCQNDEKIKIYGDKNAKKELDKEKSDSALLTFLHENKLFVGISAVVFAYLLYYKCTHQ